MSLNIGIPQIGMRAGTLYQRLEYDARQAALRNGAALWYAGGKNDLAGFVFQDSTGTTAASGTDPVGLILDRSRVAGESYASELVSNQTWTTGSAATSISGGNTVVFAGANNGAFGQASVPVVVGKTYKVTIVVSGLSAGLVGVDLGGASVYSNIAANGTYTQLITCAGGAGVIYAVAKQTTTTASVQVTSVQEAVGNLGPELSLNVGNPFTTTSGVSAANATLAVVANELEITATNVSSPQAFVSVATVTGRRYRLDYSFRRGTATDISILRNAAGTFPTIVPATTSLSLVSGSVEFVANMNNDSIIFIINATVGQTGFVDKISCKEVLGYPATQATAGNRPTLELQANGYYGMRFDASPKALNTGVLGTAAGYTSVIAASPSAYGTGYYGGFFSNPNGQYQPSVASVLAAVDNTNVASGVSVSATNTVNTPFVVSASMQSGNQKLWKNGAILITETDAVAPSASGTTLFAIGTAGVTTPVATAPGLYSLVCVGPATISDPDRIAIERFAALLSGANYV